MTNAIICMKYTEVMALHEAASSGDENSLKELLLIHGNEINSRNDKWETPLFCACAAGHLDVTRLLLGAGANINARAWKRFRPLHVAVKNGHADVTKELIIAGAGLERETIRSMTPLLVAIKSRQKVCAEILLQSNARITAKDMFDRTALHWAIKVDDRDLCDELVSRGADVNTTDKFKKTAVMQAVKSDRPEILEWLFCRPDTDTKSEDKLHRKPVHVAAMKGHCRCLDILLRSGDVSVDDTDNVYQLMTPLMSASSHGQIEAAKLLLDLGANPNKVNGYNQTALCLVLTRRRKLDANMSHWCKLVRLLIRAHTDINITALGNMGWEYDENTKHNALEMALYNGYSDIVKMLAVSGSQPHNLMKHFGTSADHIPDVIRKNLSDYEWLKQFYQSPRPLKQLCRIVFLRHFSAPRFASNLANLPPGIKAYLSFSDLDSFGPEEIETPEVDSDGDSDTEEEMEPSVFDSDLYGDCEVTDTDKEETTGRNMDIGDMQDFDIG